MSWHNPTIILLLIQKYTNVNVLQDNRTKDVTNPRPRFRKITGFIQMPNYLQQFSLLEIIALLVFQLFARRLIHNAIFLINTLTMLGTTKAIGYLSLAIIASKAMCCVSYNFNFKSVVLSSIMPETEKILVYQLSQPTPILILNWNKRKQFFSNIIN